MVKIFTRSELYELIWSRPRTALAKELGISDVAIGKHCAKEHIPGPPPGYWARLEAGRATARLPLPLRLPGQADEIALGVEDRRYWTVEENLEEDLWPPTFHEDASRQVAEAVKRLGRVTLCRDLADANGGLKRILSAEARRRAKNEQHGWSIYEPYYDAPHFQRQLRIFASLARAFGRLYGPQVVVSGDEWVQGVGHLHRLTLPLDFGGVRLALEFLEPGTVTGRRVSKSVTSTTLRIQVDAEDLNGCEWPDMPDAKLEGQLDAIAKTILERAEQALRQASQRHYERRIERRKEMRAEIERRKIEAERKRVEALAAHQEKVRAEVLELARQYRVASDIREMLALMSEHPDAMANADDLFERWKAEAMSVADLLDPMKRSLLECVPTFAKALQTKS
jgi:hypothetical protein